jgi:hypothetical protein
VNTASFGITNPRTHFTNAGVGQRNFLEAARGLNEAIEAALHAVLTNRPFISEDIRVHAMAALKAATSTKDFDLMNPSPELFAAANEAAKEVVLECDQVSDLIRKRLRVLAIAPSAGVTENIG